MASIKPSIVSEIKEAMAVCQLHHDNLHLDLFDSLQISRNGVAMVRITNPESKVGYSVEIDIMSLSTRHTTSLLFKLFVLISCGFFLGIIYKS